MLRAITAGLLWLAAVPLAADAAIAPVAIDDTVALLRPAPDSDAAGAEDCETSNVLRRLAGCSALIGSGGLGGRALARAHRNRGMALFSLGEKARAIEDFDAAIRLHEARQGADAALYLARGTAWQHLGEHARAVDDLSSAIAIDPGNAAAYGNLGVAFERLGEDARALANYDRSLLLDPDNAIVLNNRGNVLARMGERRRAIADYDRALGVDPTYASAYYNRAGERCLEGEAEPAVDDYLAAVRLGERQRGALAAFLARKGFLASDGEATADEIEAALRLWSAEACVAPASAEAGAGDPDGRAAGSAGAG